MNPITITLREVTRDTVNQILKLKVRPDQEKFVSNNAVSIAQAHFEPGAHFWAIYADETPVGFVQILNDAALATHYIWRFMIDAGQQRKGFGKQALQLVIEHFRTTLRAPFVELSYVQAEGGPEPLYRALGFVPTGHVEDGEVFARLMFDGVPGAGMAHADL